MGMKISLQLVYLITFLKYMYYIDLNAVFINVGSLLNISACFIYWFKHDTKLERKKPEKFTSLQCLTILTVKTFFLHIYLNVISASNCPNSSTYRKSFILTPFVFLFLQILSLFKFCPPSNWLASWAHI